MPKTKVTAKKVLKHGNERWRVLRPARMGGGARFFETKSAAQTFAHECNQQNNAAGRHLLGLPEHDQIRLATIVEKAGRDIGAIEAAWIEWAANNRQDVPPIADCIKDLLQTRELQGKRKRTIDTLRVRLAKFETAFYGQNLSGITTAAIEKWVYSLGVGPRTVINYLLAVSALYSHAARRKWVSRNPVKDVNRPTVEESEITFLTVDQCRELLETTREHDAGMIPFFALCMFTGARPSSVSQLTLKSFKEEGASIEIQARDQKTRTRYLATIQPNLRAWLDLGGEYKPKDRRRRFDAIKARLSFAWDESILRHTFCTYHLAHFQSADLTAKELCHRGTAMIYNHYRGLATKADAAEFWKIMP